VRFQQLIEVNLHRHGKRRGVGRNIEHLPGANVANAARIFHERKTRAPFQSDQFAVTRGVRFEDDRGAGNGHRDTFGVNGAAAGILWHAKENRTAIEFCRPPCLAETEDRVRPQAGNCQIGEGEFRAGFAARPHGRVFGDFIVHGRRPRVGFGWEKLNVADDLRDARFRRRCRNGGPGRENGQARHRAGQESGGKIHLTKATQGSS
jgi:hypothetical protein